MSRLVKLLQDHKDGDVQHYAGETIEMSDDDADWYAASIIGARMDVIEKAAELPFTPEFVAAKPVAE